MNSRNRFLKLAVTGLALMAASGCVCVTHGGGGGGGSTSGNVTLLWTFGGHKAFEVTSVTKVVVTIPGQTLQNGGVYLPTNGSADGIVLLNFKSGTYTCDVKGVTDANVVLYQATGTFTVNGDVIVKVDMSPVSGAPAYAYVTWTFPPTSLSNTPNCSQANGVTRVSIAIDNGAPQYVDCAAGFGTSGVLITSTVGTHTIDLAAADSTGFYYFTKHAQLPPLTAGGAVSADYSFEWAVGSLPLAWSFISGSTTYSCAVAGISQVRIDLYDSQNAPVYDAVNGLLLPCSSGGIQGTQLPYLYGGTYRISIQAYGGGGTMLYRSSQTVWPTGTVIPGQFPPVTSNTPAINVVH